MQDTSFYSSLYHKYQNYYEQKLQNKWLKHSDILPLINKLAKNKIFRMQNLGQSVQNRDIHLVTFGKGQIKILLWSQMHGNESTATMALFDILNFISANDEHNFIRSQVLEKATIHIIPMLNPDGAEEFRRRNAQSIDINRDAQHLQTPEARILKNAVEQIKPDFCFNLHDQSALYSTGKSFKSAAISFLAPAYDEVGSINDTRKKAIQLISFLNNTLKEFIPGHIARYKDGFEQRAFGDQIQKLGSSTILVETGYWKNDSQKQFLRKINFILLLSAIQSICNSTYKNESPDGYFDLPENEELLFDLILRNTTIVDSPIPFKADIGINFQEEIEDNKIYYKGMIEDIGDLSACYGHNEIDCEDMTIECGKIYPESIHSEIELSKLDIYKLFSNCFTSICVENVNIDSKFTKYPLIIRTKPEKKNRIEPDSVAELILRKSGDVKFIIMNGFIYNLKTGTQDIKNGVIIK